LAERGAARLFRPDDSGRDRLSRRRRIRHRGLAKADSVCADPVASSSRQAEIRDRLGRSGRLEALFTTDRAEVAAV
jgi:hypothetical protein